MSRRRGFALLAAAALVVAAVTVVVLRRGEQPQALEAKTSYDELGGREQEGDTVSNSLTYMFNRSDKPIVLQDARISASGDVPDFRFLVAGADRTDDVQGGVDSRCPPPFFKRASVRPLRGFTLEPSSTPAGKQGAVLIFCFTAPPAPARLRITETSITYRQDGELRTLTIPNRFTICVASVGRCDPESQPSETL